MPIHDNSQAWDIQNHIEMVILGVCHGEVYISLYEIPADMKVVFIHSSILGVGILRQNAKQTC